MKFDNIEAVRQVIDSLDAQLVSLIAQRSECVKAAAKFKKDSEAVRAPERVQQVIDKVREQAKLNGLSEDIIEQVYRTMITAFIDFELQQHAKLEQHN
ncbi:chorismate mutase [Providencia burhodogranariea]|uniref:chorismate mutase n=1 Tax=Providencia burhodogranariea DSM 19968 TaxID=1141662 RepID=K8WSK9_9GAMM|nr:chorismate mutase [Providencia burhodogranariea]EKT62916.1 chorismate mutase [Providencia burhodogranariea DSM 19968]